MKILIDQGSSNNLGDLAMLEGVVLYLSKIIPEAKFFTLDKSKTMKPRVWGRKNVFRQEYFKLNIPGKDFLDNLSFFWRWNNAWNRLVYYLILFLFFIGKKHPSFFRELSMFSRDFDSLVVVGGGNLNDIFLGEFFEKFWLISIFKEQNKPVILTGQQIGPFDSFISRISAKRIFQKVDFLGIRDSGDSLEFCKNIQLKKDNYCVMGDDSFGLPKADDEKVEEILDSLGLIQGGFIAFNARFSSYTREFSGHKKKLVVLVKQLAEYYKMPILVVPIAFNKNGSDVDSGQIFCNELRSDKVKLLQYDDPDPAITREIIGKAFVAVGLSYHFCTFALTKGVPAVCVYDGAYYEHKAIGLKKFWEKNILTCPLRSNSAEQIFALIKVFLGEASLKEEAILRAQDKINDWKRTINLKTKECLTK